MDQLADVPFVAWIALAAVAFVVLVLVLRRAIAIARGWGKAIAVPARVVGKRAATYGQVSSTTPSHVYTTYFATFEMGDGERLEFHLPDADYGLLAEGDEGTLTYRASRWCGFERKAIAKAGGRRKPARARRV